MGIRNDNKENGYEFKRSFRGYNIDEVDAYIEYIQADIEALQKENLELQKKLVSANQTINDYKSTERVKKQLFSDAKEEADKIVKDAKTRAAHVIMRTSRQCNRIVADMVSQVEEQKNIYDATKNEILRFRSELFGEYSAHIRKINAFVEAAGVFDADALSDEDMEGFLSMLNEDNTELENGGNFDVSDEVSVEVENIKNAAEQVAARILTDRGKNCKNFDDGIDLTVKETSDGDEKTNTVDKVVPDLNVSMKNNVTSEEDSLFLENPVKEDVKNKSENGFEEESFQKALEELKIVVGRTGKNEDITILNEVDELEYNCDEESAAKFAEEIDFSKEYEEVFDERQTECVKVGANGYGFDISNAVREEDDDEFYHEEDDEYIMTSFDGEVPTVSSDTSIELPFFDEGGGSKRWSVKKSMSITDEFDVIEAEDDYDR